MAEAGADFQPPIRMVSSNESLRNDGFCQAMLKAKLDTTPQLMDENYSVWKDKMSGLLEIRGVLNALQSPITALTTDKNAELKLLLISKMDSPKTSGRLSKRDLQPCNHQIAQGSLTNLQRGHVGIDLPEYILVYLVLLKFPASLQLLKCQIMHSDKDLKVKFVCNHLTQFNNDAKAETRESGQSEAALYAGKNKKFNKNMRGGKSNQNQGSGANQKGSRCTEGYHNLKQDYNHSSDACWHLNPKKALDWWQENQEKWKSNKDRNQVNYYMLLVTLWINRRDPKSRIILDSGASAHIFNDKKYFSRLELNDFDVIKTRKENATLPIKGMDIVMNFISPGFLDEKGCSVSTKNGGFKFTTMLQLVLQGSVKGGLYSMDEPTSIGSMESSLFTTLPKSLQEIHESFGHASISQLESFIPKTISSEERLTFECKSCVLAKIAIFQSGSVPMGEESSSVTVKGRKFHPKGDEGLLVGFDPALLSYRVLTPSGSIIKSKLVQLLKKLEYPLTTSGLEDGLDKLDFSNARPNQPYGPANPASGLTQSKRKWTELRDTKSGRTSKSARYDMADITLPKTQKGASVSFKESACNPCMYACNDGISYICFHVNELVLVGPGNDFKNKFADRFSNSACLPPNTLLGMKFKKISNKICLSQPQHINHGIEELGLTDCKPSSTPLTQNLQLREATDEDHKKLKRLNINYRSAIGLLNYIASNTFPDLSFAVSSLARYSVKPCLSHWKEVKKTLQYLQHTKDLELTIYPVKPSEFLSIYSDPTWGDDPDSRTSQSGYLCYLFGSLISWNSFRQHSIAYSSSEAEINPLVKLFHEGVWLKALINEMWNLQIELKKFGSNSKTRHIGLRTKGRCQEIKTKNIKITLVKTQDMIADAITKPTSIKPLKNLIKTVDLTFHHQN
ncbi:hypothetical protein VP01_2917g2 [Puccinia sorghi]|uniref:GAG-pre-integrase domain-containing protein n=1 Tax=Puccinia sorghi TaxID=27349 RepID=A0A0L6V1D3_9BASI|nr:hypothetical protein VP01_2917g2 [Puccinia sorghi]